ncbi:MAG: hypothetical protein RMJ67_10105, partial [Elusimicrobiota bacterium]|nr:hypothetical protein [Endomicrobiia bacterium]MDW8166844.1 hypothetical protein [Elusimicrobiota bacterium]
NNEIKTGEVNINFYGRKSPRRNWGEDNEIVLFTLKIKFYPMLHFICGGEFKSQEIEAKLLETYAHTRGYSGCVYFHPRNNPPAHITGGGWITTSPINIKEELFQKLKNEWEFIPISPTQFMRKMKNLLLDSFLLFVKENKLSRRQILNIDWGAFSYHTPLFLTYIRNKKIDEKGYTIEEIPYSFHSILKVGDDEIYISKGTIKFLKNEEFFLWNKFQ